MYTVDQIVKILGIDKKNVYSRINRLNIVRAGKEGLLNLYTEEQVNKIKNSVTDVIKYYPLKTTETFYIYESKLNTMEF